MLQLPADLAPFLFILIYFSFNGKTNNSANVNHVHKAFRIRVKISLKSDKQFQWKTKKIIVFI